MWRTILVDLMKEQGKTITAFAKELEISRQSLGFYLSGQRTPTIDVFYNMAKTLNVSSDYLLGLTKKRIANRDFQSACDCLHISEKAGHTILKYCTMSNDDKNAFEKLIDNYGELELAIGAIKKTIQCKQLAQKPSMNSSGLNYTPNDEHITPIGNGILLSHEEAAEYYAQLAAEHIKKNILHYQNPDEDLLYYLNPVQPYDNVDPE